MIVREDKNMAEKSREKESEQSGKRHGSPLRVFLTIMGVLIILIVGVIVTLNVSPIPGSLLIRKIFDSPPPAPPEDMRYEAEVIVSRDISYGNSGDEVFDLYLPAANKGMESRESKEGSLPLIIWVHGGAFVGGDKVDVEYLARALAVNGYAVACINYSRAPEAAYPTPVLQTGLAYVFLTNNKYPGSDRVDTGRVFLAGDSAGAHIAAQFANLQTNLDYRAGFLSAHSIHESMDFPGLISKDVLRGVLLYCGPYSMQQLLDAENPMFKVLVHQTGWAYFKDKDPARGQYSVEADIIQNVTRDFPPAFITDGNTLSFPQHAKELMARLSALGATYHELFFDENPALIVHEYQFDLTKDAGLQALEEALRFLDEQLK